MTYSFFINFNYENTKFTDVINKFQRYLIILCMINSPIGKLIHTIIKLFRIVLYIKIIENCFFPLLNLPLQFIQNRTIKSYIFWRLLQFDKA
jgi:hypothetical protein